MEVGEADAGLEKGGGGCPELRTGILEGGPVGPAICIQDVGDDATHQEAVGRIPTQGGPQVDREANLDREGRSMDIPSAGG